MIAHRLLTDGFHVVSISSLALARFREARFGTWEKNDPKDAQVIIAMMEQGMIQIYRDPLLTGAHDWQELSNTYFHSTLERTRLQHSLMLHHLPLYFPEFLHYWYLARSTWFVHFLERFPRPPRSAPSIARRSSPRLGRLRAARSTSEPNSKRSMIWPAKVSVFP